MIANMRVDAFASYPHYHDHIAPIWDLLDSEGTFYVSPNTKRPGSSTRGLMASDVPTIVAGYPDYKRIRRPIIFVEHGIGENYGLRDPHYSGGQNRSRVELFLCPNQRVFDANEEHYPGRSVIVGSPRVESLAEVVSLKMQQGSRDDHPLRVVVSFHWNCTVHPQARTALHNYHPDFPNWVADKRIEVMGHSHPRIRPLAERFFYSSGIEFISEFTDVLRWADVYAVDNSSTLFEAAGLGLPVVVLDAPHFTPEQTGFRFWKYADIGPRINPSDDLGDAAIHAHDNLSGYDDIRRRMVTEVFGAIEGAGRRAVKAITTHVNSQGSPSSADTGADPTQPSLFSSR